MIVRFRKVEAKYNKDDIKFLKQMRTNLKRRLRNIKDGPAREHVKKQIEKIEGVLNGSNKRSGR